MRLCAGGHVCWSCVHPAGSAVEHVPRCDSASWHYGSVHHRRSDILLLRAVHTKAQQHKHDICCFKCSSFLNLLSLNGCQIGKNSSESDTNDIFLLCSYCYGLYTSIIIELEWWFSDRRNYVFWNFKCFFSYWFTVSNRSKCHTLVTWTKPKMQPKFQIKYEMSV